MYYIHNLCKFIGYINLGMHYLNHYFYDICPFYTYLIACQLHTQSYGPKIIWYQYCNCKHDQTNSK